jgi:hypothetical protein
MNILFASRASILPNCPPPIIPKVSPFVLEKLSTAENDDNKCDTTA